MKEMRAQIKETAIPNPFLLMDANVRIFIMLGFNLVNPREHMKKPLIRC